MKKSKTHILVGIGLMSGFVASANANFIDEATKSTYIAKVNEQIEQINNEPNGVTVKHNILSHVENEITDQFIVTVSDYNGTQEHTIDNVTRFEGMSILMDSKLVGYKVEDLSSPSGQSVTSKDSLDEFTMDLALSSKISVDGKAKFDLNITNIDSPNLSKRRYTKIFKDWNATATGEFLEHGFLVDRAKLNMGAALIQPRGYDSSKGTLVDRFVFNGGDLTLTTDVAFGDKPINLSEHGDLTETGVSEIMPFDGVVNLTANINQVQITEKGKSKPVFQMQGSKSDFEFAMALTEDAFTINKIKAESFTKATYTSDQEAQSAGIIDGNYSDITSKFEFKDFVLSSESMANVLGESVDLSDINGIIQAIFIEPTSVGVAYSAKTTGESEDNLNIDLNLQLIPENLDGIYPNIMMDQTAILNVFNGHGHIEISRDFFESIKNQETIDLINQMVGMKVLQPSGDALKSEITIKDAVFKAGALEFSKDGMLIDGVSAQP